jgi:5-hydroxyisourate hydrolase
VSKHPTKAARAKSGSPITSHVLDTALGRPAAGVEVVLARLIDGAFAEIGRGTTDADGRVAGLHPEAPPQAGVYRLTFATGAYFARSQRACFHPTIEVCFEISAATLNDGARHVHVPLLIAPFGYSTYRGS